MKLRCEEAQRAIPWLLDDELDTEQALEVEAHIQQCGACRGIVQKEGSLRLALRRAGASVYAPASLRRRVRESVDTELRRGNSAYQRYWPAAMAAAVLLSFMWQGATGGLSEELVEVAQRHARDLPMDVSAASTAPVQSYVAANVSFPVHVPTIPQPSVSNVGGRIIQLGNRDAVQLRYVTDRGRLSVFVYEDPTGVEESEVAPTYVVGGRRMVVRRVRGFTTARWRSAGLVYSVVSDLPEQDLDLTLRQLR